MNVTRLFDHNTIQLDTSLRFTGIGYDIVRDTNSLQQYIDSNYVAVLDNARTPLKWATLPSRINLAWNHKLSCRTNLVVSLQAVDLGRYGITGTAGIDHEFTDRFRLYSSLGYGNFAGIIWGEAAEYRFKKFNVYARVQGLQALVIPKASTNYALSFGASKRL